MVSYIEFDFLKKKKYPYTEKTVNAAANNWILTIVFYYNIDNPCDILLATHHIIYDILYTKVKLTVSLEQSYFHCLKQKTALLRQLFQ